MVFLGCQQSSAGMHYPKYSDIHGNRCILAYHGGECHRPGLIPGYRSIRRWTDDTYVVPQSHKYIPDVLMRIRTFKQDHVVWLFPRVHIFPPYLIYIGNGKRIFFSVLTPKVGIRTPCIRQQDITIVYVTAQVSEVGQNMLPWLPLAFPCK